MATNPRATITALAQHIPRDVLTNTYFAGQCDTTDEWIRSRTGIVERRVATGQRTSEMIVPAAIACLEQRGLDARDLDCIIVTTCTPDYAMPSTAAIVQRAIGAENAWGFDLNAACSGFVFGLITAVRFIESRAMHRVLVCAADRMSAITDPRDRQTGFLFGDAAGVALVERARPLSGGVIDCRAWMDGSGAPHLVAPVGGNIRQDGSVVFRAAVTGMSSLITNLAAANGCPVETIDWLAPHQANARILSAVADRAGIAAERVLTNIELMGNTGAATVPTCLAAAHVDGRLQAGHRVMLVSFGAGFTAGAVLMDWTLPACAKAPADKRAELSLETAAEATAGATLR
jgi:3-oxoacyl-[acyl-carrier-protein] synthase-3